MNNREIINRLSHFMFLNDIVESGAYAKLSSSAKIIYPIIGLHINRDGEAFPSISRIERLSGLSRPSVVSATKELIDRGFIIKVKGNARISNRYRIVFEYEGSSIGELQKLNGLTRGECNNLTTEVKNVYQKVVNKFNPNKLIYNKVIQLSKKKQEITTNIINIQDSQVNISKDSGSNNIFQKIVHELNLKDTGKDLLRKYMDDYSEDWVNRAFTESVKRSNPNLHYIEGILKKWQKNGRISEGTLQDLILEKKQEKINKQNEIKRLEESNIKNYENQSKMADDIINSLTKEEKQNLKKEADVLLENEGITENTPGYNLALKIKQRELTLSKL